MITDQDAPGRGPGHMFMFYRWERVDDLPILGYFAGVAIGVRKGADTLFVDISDDEEEPQYLSIRYEDLVGVALIDDCPKCDRCLLVRSKRKKRRWHCEGCGYVEYREVEGTNPIHGLRDLERRQAKWGRS